MATLREVKKRIKTVVSTLLVLVVVLVSCSITLQAQSKLSFGPKAGLSLSSPYHSGWSNAFFETGISGGAFLSIKLSDQLSIQTEALYVEKNPTFSIGNFISRISTDYLEIPLFAKWKLSPNRNSSFSFFAGGAIALNLTATLPRWSGFEPVNSNYDIKDLVKDLDFSLVFGGGFDIPAGSGNLTVDLRYTHGLRSIIESSFFDNTKNRTFLALIGYSLPLGT